jgi:CheY-like chemotaxis protein
MSQALLVAEAAGTIQSVQAALSGTAWRLSIGSDPRQAVGLWVEAHHEVVLIDSQIGSMGGMAVSRDLRAAAVGAGIDPPSIVLLLDRDLDAALARRSGAAASILKPFRIFEMRRLIDRLGPGGRAVSPS